MASQIEIAQQVVESILAQKLKPGERLGEQELADMFGVSRTLVREALMQLQARGFVEVRTRKGWYVVNRRSTKRVMPSRRGGRSKPACCVIRSCCATPASRCRQIGRASCRERV